MPNPFITYDQQIALLKSKHLVISDEDAAKRVLAQIGYFSLIGGYKYPFKNRTTRMYRDGVTFEDIVMLYNFDESLRRLFLRYTSLFRTFLTVRRISSNVSQLSAIRSITEIRPCACRCGMFPVSSAAPSIRTIFLHSHAVVQTT